MKKLMFGLCLLIFAVTSCTQYIYVPVDKLPWIDDDKEEQEEFVPNITDNAGFAAAIADIKAGDTVELKVGAGTYTQQIVIPEGADVTIVGEGETDTIITLPEDITGFETIPAAAGESLPYTGVIVANGGKVTLKNLTVQGDPEKNVVMTNGGLNRLSVFTAVNASVYAENVTFTGSYLGETSFGVQNGINIYLVGDGTDNDAYFKNCTVTDFNKGGIVVREGVKSFTFIDGKVIGAGSTDGTAQNGIQTACVNSTITGNLIKDIDYTDTDYIECGIMLYNEKFTEAQRVEIRDKNTFENCPNKLTIYPIAAPTDFTAVKNTDANTITFSWTPSTSECVVGYGVYSNESDESYDFIGRETSTHTIELGENAAASSYMIYAYDEFGFSSSDATATVTEE